MSRKKCTTSSGRDSAVRYPLRRVRGLLGSQGRGRWERLRFESTRLRPCVRSDFRWSTNPKNKGAALRPFGAYDSKEVLSQRTNDY